MAATASDGVRPGFGCMRCQALSCLVSIRLSIPTSKASDLAPSIHFAVSRMNKVSHDVLEASLKGIKRIPRGEVLFYNEPFAAVPFGFRDNR